MHQLTGPDVPEQTGPVPVQGLNVTNTTDPGVLCSGKKLFEILKVTDLDDCSHRPFFRKQSGLESNQCDGSQASCIDKLSVSQL